MPPLPGPQETPAIRPFLFVHGTCLCVWMAIIAFQPWNVDSPMSLVVFLCMGSTLVLVQVVALIWQAIRNQGVITGNASSIVQDANDDRRSTLWLIWLFCLPLAFLPPLVAVYLFEIPVRLAWYAATHWQATTVKNGTGEDRIIFGGLDAMVVDLSGRIDWGTSLKLRRHEKDALRQYGAEHIVLRLRLSSEPDRLPDDHPAMKYLSAEMTELASTIREDGMRTVAPFMCGGTCSFLFLSGRERFITSDTYVKLSALPEWLMEPAAQKVFLKSAGLEDETVRRIMSASLDSPWQPDARTMFDTGIVTAVLPDSEDLFKVIVSIFGVSEIETRKTFLKAQNEGTSYDAVWGSISSVLLMGTIQRLPFASEDQIRTFAGLMAAHIRSMHDNDPSQCETYKSGEFPSFYVPDTIDPGLLRRQRDLFASILANVDLPSRHLSEYQRKLSLQTLGLNQNKMDRARKTLERMIEAREKPLKKGGRGKTRPSDAISGHACMETALLYDDTASLPAEEAAYVIARISVNVLARERLRSMMDTLGRQ